MCYGKKEVDIEEFKGQTIVDVRKANEKLIFVMKDGTEYEMFHLQDCCEYVYLEDVVGDLEKLRGEVFRAYEARNRDIPPRQDNPDSPNSWEDDSYTWTFYRIATHNQEVTLRWYGSSNGYYGEEVRIYREYKDGENVRG